MRKMNSIKAKPLSISLKLHVVLYYIFLIIAPFLLLGCSVRQYYVQVYLQNLWKISGYQSGIHTGTAEYGL